MCRIPHRHSGDWKTRAIHFTFYFTSSPEHKIFLFFTGLNNGDINIFRMASLQNTLNNHRLKNNLLSCKSVNNLDSVLSNNTKSEDSGSHEDISSI